MLKSENNGNGVYIVPFYSNNLIGSIWFTELSIYDKNQNLTQVFLIDFHKMVKIEPSCLVNLKMMVNFISDDPRMFIYDIGAGKITYSNWCDDHRSGLYKGRASTAWKNKTDL